MTPQCSWYIYLKNVYLKWKEIECLFKQYAPNLSSRFHSNVLFVQLGASWEAGNQASWSYQFMCIYMCIEALQTWLRHISSNTMVTLQTMRKSKEIFLIEFTVVQFLDIVKPYNDRILTLFHFCWNCKKNQTNHKFNWVLLEPLKRIVKGTLNVEYACVLHNLQGQFSGIHLLRFTLKLFNEVASL